MPSFRIERSLVADSEFLSLPRAVRETFIEAFHKWEGATSPLIPGRSRSIEELRQRRVAFPQGVYSLPVGPIYRGLFIRTGGTLRFIVFGAHLPSDDVHRKLARARNELTRRSKDG